MFKYLLYVLKGCAKEKILIYITHKLIIHRWFYFFCFVNTTSIESQDELSLPSLIWRPLEQQRNPESDSLKPTPEDRAWAFLPTDCLHWHLIQSKWISKSWCIQLDHTLLYQLHTKNQDMIFKSRKWGEQSTEEQAFERLTALVLTQREECVPALSRVQLPFSGIAPVMLTCCRLVSSRTTAYAPRLQGIITTFHLYS